jgi:hypothetical protein
MLPGYNGNRPLNVCIADPGVIFPPTNSSRRVLFLVPCPICKNDFEVRDGKWIPITFPSGRKIQLKVCDNCSKDEITSNE